MTAVLLIFLVLFGAGLIILAFRIDKLEDQRDRCRIELRHCKCCLHEQYRENVLLSVENDMLTEQVHEAERAIERATDKLRRINNLLEGGTACSTDTTSRTAS